MSAVSSSRVHEIKLRLRMSEVDEPRASALRELAERHLLRGVLDSLDAAVRARLGPYAIVRIRRLPLRWRLEGHELAEPSVHRRLGEELADGVIEAAGARTAIPAWPARDAIYAVFSDQAHAIAVAIVDRVEGRAAFHHPATTPEELWRLAASGTTETGEPMVLAVIRRLAALSAPLEAVASLPSSIAGPLVEEVRSITGVPTAWSRMIAETAARAVPSTARAGSATDAASADNRVAGHADSPATTRVDAGAVASGELPRAPDGIANRRGQASTEGSPAQDAVTAAPEVRIEDVPHALRTGTEVAGAAFAIARALELDLAEHLWCAGVPEGRVLASAIARVVPAEHRRDPLLGMIAGRFDGSPVEPVEIPAWAGLEVRERTRDSVGRWLARRGDIQNVESVDHALREIEATIEGCGTVESALAAAMSAIACARLGVAWDAAILRSLVVRSGVVVLDGEEIIVEMPLASVDVDVRRAGLDVNPGWIPWLRRRMRIDYVSGIGDVL